MAISTVENIIQFNITFFTPILRTVFWVATETRILALIFDLLTNPEKTEALSKVCERVSLV